VNISTIWTNLILFGIEVVILVVAIVVVTRVVRRHFS
jgi:cytochrome c-type biogenesis protein CcmH/NrfF